MNENTIKNVSIPLLQDEAIINDIIETQEKKKRIYHYTSMDTFYKIIEDSYNGVFTFRASSVYTMNDTQEMKLGYYYLKKYLPTIEIQLNIKQEERLFYLFNDEEKNNEIKSKFGDWMINDDTTNFVVSFSTESDILPMWSQYGGNGTGVCLEFSPYIIESYYNSHNIDKYMRIDECVYDEEDIEKHMLFYLETIYKLFLESNNEPYRTNRLVKEKFLAIMYGLSCAYVKHKGFEYEKEVRMNLFREKEHWEFGETRNGNRNIYTNVPIPLEALKGVIIGPAANMSTVRNPMILALRKKGIIIEPVQSEIPFRVY